MASSSDHAHKEKTVDSTSDHEFTVVDLFDSTVEKLRAYMEKVVTAIGGEEEVKGALLLIKQGEIKLATAFPSSEKLVYANIGFGSSVQNIYYEFEDDDDEKKEGDDDKNERDEEGDERKKLKDMMIKDMIEGCKWENLTKSAIEVLKSRCDSLPCDQIQELVDLVTLINKKKSEDEDED